MRRPRSAGDQGRTSQARRPPGRWRFAAVVSRYAVRDVHLRSWLETHPVGAFVALAFGVSYLVGGPVLLAGAALMPTDAALLRAYAPRILVVFGPGVAALVLAHLSRRDGGAASLLRRLVPSWTDAAWAAGILVVGAAAGTAALSVAGWSPKEVGEAVSAHPALLAAHAALQIGIVATGEELGWRGWLLPRLAERTNRLNATLATAGVWGAWHAPLLLSGALPAATFLLMVFGLSALFTWVWSRRRGQLFALVAAHAAVNIPLFLVGAVPGPHGDSLRMAWSALEAIYATAGLALVVVRWRWWTEPVSPDHF